jgi:hypothetical protein
MCYRVSELQYSWLDVKSKFIISQCIFARWLTVKLGFRFLPKPRRFVTFTPSQSWSEFSSFHPSNNLLLSWNFIVHRLLNLSQLYPIPNFTAYFFKMFQYYSLQNFQNYMQISCAPPISPFKQNSVSKCVEHVWVIFSISISLIS